MFYVYLLRSTANPKKSYVGITDCVSARLDRHNARGVPSTARFAPWDLIAFIAVRERTRAAELERYFKSGSGHAFAQKRLW